MHYVLLPHNFGASLQYAALFHDGLYTSRILCSDHFVNHTSGLTLTVVNIKDSKEGYVRTHATHH